jgi:hypothetical protein
MRRGDGLWACALLLAGLPVAAQVTVSSSVVGAAGGTAAVGSWTMDFTVGEPVVQTWALPPLAAPGVAPFAGQTTQGFHQPHRIKVPISPPTGLSEASLQPAEVFPNPFRDVLQLGLPAGIWDLQLFDGQGRRVAHLPAVSPAGPSPAFSDAPVSSGGGRVEWGLAGLASGSYVLVMRNDRGQWAQSHVIKVQD